MTLSYFFSQKSYQIKLWDKFRMATYIESALGDFIKSIMTRGIRTLKSPRFFPYSAFLFLIVGITTLTAFLDQITDEVSDSLKDNLLFLELAAAISFVWIGIFLGRANIKFQIIAILGSTTGLTFFLKSEILDDPTKVTFNVAAVFYILWIGIVAFSTFSVIRDLIANETFGTILFLGKPEDDGKVMFSTLAWVLVFVNIGLGYFVLQTSGISDGIYLSGLIIIILSLLAVIPLLGFQSRNDGFWTILTSFYMFTTIKIVLFTFQVASGGGNESTSVWDILFSLFIALYAIQNAAARGITLGQKVDNEEGVDTLEEELMLQEKRGLTSKLARLLSDRGIVLVILGIVLGYHTMQVQTILGQETNFLQDVSIFEGAGIVILGHEVNLLISLIIYIVSLVLFILLPPFRRYANPEINRITWLPPYEDLKDVITNIKSGEIAWKMDVTKMIIGMGKDKLVSKFSRKKKSKTTEQRFTSTWKKLRGKKD
ncbi:MAG: hypothetical protein HeimC2_15880 [Candidatus Heimdallarchaeota archaeon LC_2]|nr:MAG: hypothetical protein HeimC2_15880 [Candidatus Heimdallarchaeota archaeon LC_2]